MTTWVEMYRKRRMHWQRSRVLRGLLEVGGRWYDRHAFRRALLEKYPDRTFMEIERMITPGLYELEWRRVR